jgi:hypothetical protein
MFRSNFTLYLLLLRWKFNAVSGNSRHLRGTWTHSVGKVHSIILYMFFWVFLRRHIEPLKMDLTEGSETSAKLNLMPGKYPKEHIQDSEHGENLKSCIVLVGHWFIQPSSPCTDRATPASLYSKFPNIQNVCVCVSFGVCADLWSLRPKANNRRTFWD